MLCIRCGGSGRYFGIGMMITDCDLCDDSEASHHVAPKIDRRSKEYHKAIKDIMEINPKITKKEAVTMFDKAYNEV